MLTRIEARIFNHDCSLLGLEHAFRLISLDHCESSYSNEVTHLCIVVSSSRGGIAITNSLIDLRARWPFLSIDAIFISQKWDKGRVVQWMEMKMLYDVTCWLFGGKWARGFCSDWVHGVCLINQRYSGSVTPMWGYLLFMLRTNKGFFHDPKD